jgi:hypothetical protein
MTTRATRLPITIAVVRPAIVLVLFIRIIFLGQA